MSTLEIVSAVMLILSCVLIIVVVLAQESKKGMSQAITGASADNYYQKNSGRTKEAKLAKVTKVAAALLFVVTLAVNLASTVSRNTKTDEPDTTPAAIEAVTMPAATETAATTSAEGNGE